MKALVKNEPEPGMDLEDVPTPEPGPEEVRLRVESVGIDGGEEALIYDWHEGKHHLESELPRIFGHEFAGTVDAVGTDVTRVEEGDRVAVEPGDTCGECRHCRAGEPNICVDRELVGVDRDGALAEHVVVPEGSVYPVGDDVTFDEAAYLEVLALGVNAVEYSRLEPGDSAAITGPGPVGLAALTACAAAGADPITVIGAGIDTGTRLPVAEEMGAARTRTIEEGALEEPVDVFFEASGHPSALERAVEDVRRGGQIVQIGVYHGEDTVPLAANRLTLNGIGYRPIRARRDSSWRRAISIAGYTDLSPIVGPAYGMEDYEEAFAAVRNREGVKVLLRP